METKTGALKPKNRKRHKIVGLRVKKNFDGVIYYGRITSIDTELSRGDKKARKLFHIVYDDGDEEDIYKPEVKRIVIFPKTRKPTSAKRGTDSSKTKKKLPAATGSSEVAKKTPSPPAECAGGSSNSNALVKKKPLAAPESTNGPEKIQFSSTQSAGSEPISATSNSNTNGRLSKKPVDGAEDHLLEEVRSLFDEDDNPRDTAPEKKKKRKSASKEDNFPKTKKVSSQVGTKQPVGQPRQKPRGRPPKGKVWDYTLGKWVDDTEKTNQPAKTKRSRAVGDYGSSRTGVKRKKTKAGNALRSLCSFLCHICHMSEGPVWRCPKNHRHFFCSHCTCDLDDFEKLVTDGCVLCREEEVCGCVICDLVKEEEKLDAMGRTRWIHKMTDDGHVEEKKWPVLKPIPAGYTLGRGFAWIHGMDNGIASRKMWPKAKPLPPGFTSVRGDHTPRAESADVSNDGTDQTVNHQTKEEPQTTAPKDSNDDQDSKLT